LAKPKLDEVKAFATLLTNLGKKKRSENLLRLSEYCVGLKERYGSWVKLAEKVRISDTRAHISAEMLREFGAIANLPAEIKRMIKDEMITSVDTAYRISLLDNSEDQISLAKSIVDKKISVPDVRAIVEYKLKNPEVSIKDAVQRVLESKTKTVTHHIVIMELKEKTFAALKEEARRTKQSCDSLALTLLTKRWNEGWISSFGLRGTDILLKISDDGFKTLKQEANRLHISLKDLANNIIEKELQTVN
jgi:hypothetical protein